MEPKEFIKIAENHIYKEIAKYTNMIMGKHKTAALSTGIFLKLPIVVSTIKVTEELPILNTEISSLLDRLATYVLGGDATSVYFEFLYNEEKDLKKMARYLSKFNVFFAFLYMHEVQHILRKHNTSSYDRLMENIAGGPSDLINIAEDHAINYSLKDLFLLDPNSILAAEWPKIEATGIYNRQYHDDKLSDIEILKLLLKDSPQCSSCSIGESLVKIDCEGKSKITSSKQSSKDGEGAESNSKCSTAVDDADAALADLADSLKEIISTNLKGSQAGDLFEDVFKSIEVETGWFKKIKASFKRQVYYKTHDYSTNWANLNSTYRHIYKAPKKQFLDSKIKIILSVDHSGSMSTQDLQKLLYLVESESARISELTVLIHDTRIVKEFNIKDDYDISNNAEFTQALATRYVSGGTSHDCVFKHIEQMPIKDPNMVIYMSFSDNYSDIEEAYSNYPKFHRLTKYWICAGANNPVKVPGTNIRMV